VNSRCCRPFTTTPRTPSAAADVGGELNRVTWGSFARPLAAVSPALATIVSPGAAPCRDESRDGTGANRSPKAFINGLIFALKGLALGW
jgi:hypothetical protein